MKVYALVGKSGTGKSHHSMWVARENQIEYIIDDGLLISDNKIVAGKSAKREPTKVASVRCAVFSDPEHAASVRKAIAEHHVDSILIIGTSEKMVYKIADALRLGEIQKIIHIEDVSTPEEREIAAEMRNKQGKHVIPVPTFELKRQFSGYFTDPLMLLFKKKGQTIVEEKTVMRPAYSYLGEYKISARAISDICTYEAMRLPSIHKVLRIRHSTTPGGRLMLEVDVSVNFPCRVSYQAALAAERIKTAVEEFTAITVRWVHVNVKTLNIKREENHDMP
ncbi:Asp23/Gls24 family envelope stress response protein [Ructibacterium gallinarum]|uniref:Asp23/Gls24 family envelope stress response protein n=1 Tax=Ructibacterium gallinarum TaxID=2779355 RepID=A0A9D5M0X0_9FIRM|nr:hypothetical protein [Ructibacterium gallinarum]MBE5040101.1 hypothetical protein [Ructibacterium gallinarum]